MKPSGIVGAVVGGVVGALLWGFFTHLSGLEVGYLAWGIGGLVGFGCLCLGGRGQAAATVCAVVALLSIMGGKFFATHMAVGEAIEQLAHNLHGEMVADAKNFASIEEFEYPEFMVAHKYTEAADAQGIQPEELAYFKEYSVPALRQLSLSPDYATWRESQYAENYCDNVAAALSVQTLVFDNLGLIDIVFFLLGVITAFKMVLGQDRAKEEEETQSRATVAAAEREAGLHEQPEKDREEQPQL